MHQFLGDYYLGLKSGWISKLSKTKTVLLTNEEYLQPHYEMKISNCSENCQWSLNAKTIDEFEV